MLLKLPKNLERKNLECKTDNWGNQHVMYL